MQSTVPILDNFQTWVTLFLALFSSSFELNLPHEFSLFPFISILTTS